MLSDLERFNKGPEQCANALPLAKQLNQSHYTEQTEESDRHPRTVL